MTSDVHPGPLPQTPPTDEHHAGPLAQAAAERPKKAKKTWREERWERRRRRRVGEEILAWILVPIIIISAYWAVEGGLGALGTSPTALIDGIKTAISASGRS